MSFMGKEKILPSNILPKKYLKKSVRSNNDEKAIFLKKKIGEYFQYWIKIAQFAVFDHNSDFIFIG